MTVRSVAIACQGGGTHAAFCWGVLDEILKTKKKWDSEGWPERFDITAITGTSAGALCALMVWYGFAPKTNLPGSGSLDEALATLDRFWENFAAREPVEVWHNAMSVAAFEAKEKGVPLPAVNPYGVVDDIILAQLTMLGARKEYVDFDAMLTAACPEFETVDWPQVAMRAMVGASEIRSGAETVFDTRKNQEDLGIKDPSPAAAEHQWRQRRAFSLQGVAASGTLPSIREAEEIGDGRYWDGLYSQNPPIRELVAGPPQAEMAHEIWVVRINPQNIRKEPTTPETIKDRENELMGNLSLNKELDFINVVNRWVENYADFAEDKKQVTLRTIKMRQKTALNLRVASKFDRSAEHMNELRQEGMVVAREWLAGWPHDVGTYPDDAGYPINVD
jgi:NTE family protein